MTKGRCHRCNEEGLRSRVQVGSQTSTLMANVGWYDEDGHYHYHDMNRRTVQYSCSNGHAWSESKASPCGAANCTFGSEEPTITYRSTHG
jgi:hypothetical protein